MIDEYILDGSEWYLITDEPIVWKSRKERQKEMEKMCPNMYKFLKRHEKEAK